ncbi:MAG: RHS repeat-associated core domain-containing protein [Halanaerobiales bacterium]
MQNNDGEGYKYTGQKEVVSIGLYYYGARYYDPEIGRFITEDSYFGQLALPQSQNLYVYVMNNSMMFVDPSGNSAEEYDFDMDLDLSPSEYDFSLTDFKFEIPDPWEMIYEGVSFRESNDFAVIRIEYEAIKNNTIEITTYINKANETVGETVERLSENKNIIAAVNGTFFSPPYKAFGHIVNNGNDETLYNEIDEGLGYKKAFVKNRSFFGIDGSGYSFIGEANYNRGSILNNNPNLI